MAQISVYYDLIVISPLSSFWQRHETAATGINISALSFRIKYL